jgi:F-type H+-transporting ATPase subunit b
MEEIAQVYSRSLFEVAKEHGKLDRIRDELAEYRERLSEAREQAETILARARKAADATESAALSDAKAKREELMEATKREIAAETRRAIQDIRNEVADLTILATEKITRKSLTADDQKRLVEEALSELDFSALAGERSN